MSTLTLLLTSFFSALAAVGGTRKLATQLKIGALPSARKIHTEFKPVLGGIGIFTGLIIGIATAVAMNILPESIWQSKQYFWGGLLVIIITGLIDDIRGLNAWQKFIGEFLAAGLLVADGCLIQAFFSPGETVFELGWIGVPFTMLWIVFIMNAINLLDGLDGLSSGIALIITSGFLFLAIAMGNVFLIVLSISLIGGLLGFLRFNYHPASIFMGDVGSLMLGYLLAAFSIEGMKIAGSTQVYFLASLVMLGMPVTDTLISFFRRMGRGDHPFKPDREHIHHRLLNLGLSHVDSVWLMYYFTLLYTTLGVLMVLYRDLMGIPLFIVALAFSIYWAWRLGYVETRRYLTFDEMDESELAVRRPPIRVDRIWHQIAIFFGDILSINLAMYLTWWFRFQSGMVNPLTLRSLQDYLVAPVWLVFTGIWVLLFWLNGLYQMPWDVSRFSKVVRVTKVVTFGILMLLLLLNFDIFLEQDTASLFNMMQLTTLGVYWLALVVLVSGVRLLIISIEKRLHIFEYTYKNTLVFGTTRKARNVIRDIRKNPHLLNHIVGVVDRKAKCDEFEGFPVLKDYQNLPQLIHEHRVEEIIIAISESAKEDLLNISAICDRMQIVVKTIPELLSAVSGHSGDIGNGVVRAFPDNLLHWQWFIKRLSDLLWGLIALLALIIPGLILGIIAFRKFGRFPIGKVQIVGKQGRLFGMLLFHLDREDVLDTAYASGDFPKPLSAYGDWLYSTQIYKLPMILNLLRGNLSLVGPRPEPLAWYRQYQRRLRLLHRRVLVRPGITGLAQMKYRFESSQKDMRERLKYDIFYSEHISLSLDARILLRSLLILLRKLIGR